MGLLCGAGRWLTAALMQLLINAPGSALSPNMKHNIRITVLSFAMAATLHRHCEVHLCSVDVSDEFIQFKRV